MLKKTLSISTEPAFGKSSNINRPEFQAYLDQFRAARDQYFTKTKFKFPFGYPLNIDGIEALTPFYEGIEVLNNVGDPLNPASGHFTLHSLEQEASLIEKLKQPWLSEAHPIKAYIGTGGTEGNDAGISVGVSCLPTPIIIYSKEAHYSIPKIARNKRLPSVVVDTTPQGAMDCNHLNEILKSLKTNNIIIVATLGTTMKGANDPLMAINDCLRRHDFGDKNSYVHLDAAFHGGFWPVIDDTEIIRPKLGIDMNSISISAHKWYGGVVAGFFMCLEKDVSGSFIDYLNAVDFTQSGSRNGLNPILWTARYHQFDWKAKYKYCQELMGYALSLFNKYDIEAWSNSPSLTLVFPKPTERLCREYQLATSEDETGKEIAHIIILPHHTKESLDTFVADFRNEKVSKAHAKL